MCTPDGLWLALALALLLLLLLLFGILGVGLAQPSGQGKEPPVHLAAGSPPTMISYQGVIRVAGIPHWGEGHFKFAIVDTTRTTTYWSNDGTSTSGDEPANAVTLGVKDGL